MAIYLKKTGEWSRLLAGAALLISAAGAVSEVREAEQLVQRTTDQVLELIEDSRGYAKEDPERFYAEVEKLLSPAIDFPRFARSVMAAHYRDATPAQRERFADGFKWSLVRTYALALTEFNDGSVEIIPSDRPPRQPDRASVKQEIRSGGDVYPVVYSLVRSKDDGWRVLNIIINGINMGLTYRNQFASAMQDPRYGGDLDRTIDGWVASLGSVEADPNSRPQDSAPDEVRDAQPEAAKAASEGREAGAGADRSETSSPT